MTKQQIKEWVDYLTELIAYQQELVVWLFNQRNAARDGDDEGSNPPPPNPPLPPKPPGS